MSENAVNVKNQLGKSAAVSAYDKIVESVQLVDIRLLKLNFDVKADYYGFMAEENMGRKSVERSFNCNIADLNYDPETLMLGGQLDWETSVKVSRKKLLKVEARFLIMYQEVPNVGLEHTTAYMGKVGRFATYPYFRSLVAQLSWESRTELPVMPVLKA